MSKLVSLVLRGVPADSSDGCIIASLEILGRLKNYRRFGQQERPDIVFFDFEDKELQKSFSSGVVFVDYKDDCLVLKACEGREKSLEMRPPPKSSPERLQKARELRESRMEERERRQEGKRVEKNIKSDNKKKEEKKQAKKEKYEMEEEEEVKEEDKEMPPLRKLGVMRADVTFVKCFGCQHKNLVMEDVAQTFCGNCSTLIGVCLSKDCRRENLVYFKSDGQSNFNFCCWCGFDQRRRTPA